MFKVSTFSMISSRISGGAGGASIRCTVVANSVSSQILGGFSSRLTLLFSDDLTQPDDFIDVLLAKRHANDDHVALRQLVC
jgi:hypothetical protein